MLWKSGALWLVIKARNDSQTVAWSQIANFTIVILSSDCCYYYYSVHLGSCGTQVGWEQRKVVAAFSESPKEVKLIVKKQPHHLMFAGFEKRKAPPRKELPKLNVGPKLRRSYGRKSRKVALNSSLDDHLSQSSIDRSSSLLWSSGHGGLMITCLEMQIFVKFFHCQNFVKHFNRS